MRQALVETSQCHRLISPNSIGHSDKVMKNAKVANSSVCVWCLPLPNRWYPYLGNIQGTVLVGNSSDHAGKPVTVSVRGIVQLENEIWFLIIKNVNSWCYQVLLKDINIFLLVCFPLDFHKVPNSPKYYVTVYFVFERWVTFLHTSPKLWKQRLHESVLVVILWGHSWLSDDIISMP